ncbi:hypothetical protein OBBRIDRAFT_794373 [Obba rivulosa]|uniref:F-box protein n=1 Tax=Obba rivulosa TaxID=1052685 RepID=A0A8E2DKZ1_9APHY|nr:hypothetical protein OBBRIDRAFT_794373 [Obba rivulosa]
MAYFPINISVPLSGAFDGLRFLECDPDDDEISTDSDVDFVVGDPEDGAHEVTNHPEALWLAPGIALHDVTILYTEVRPESQAKRLRLSGNLLKKTQDLTFIRTLIDHSWVDEFIPFLTRLHGVRTLHLESLSWGCLSAAARACLLSSFRHITTLWIENVDFWNSWQLLRTLDAFPQLKVLRIVKVNYTFDNCATHQTSSSIPLQLGALSITETRRLRPILKWILGMRSDIVVNKAQLSLESIEVDVLVELLRAVAPNIRRLHYIQRIEHPEGCCVDPLCHILGDEDQDNGPAFARLNSRVPPEDSYESAKDMLKEPLECPWLESIFADIWWSGSDLDSGDPDILAVEILCHLISPRTTSFRLNIVMKDPQRFLSTNWAKLDDALSQMEERPAGYERPLLLIVLDGDFATAEVTLENRLRKTIERGVFSVYLDGAEVYDDPGTATRVAS